MVAPAGAQQYQRRASIVGGGSANQGKCTIEVEVDGAASVEIRGDQGVIRNLSGQPAVWRRFECTGPVPSNSTSFRFAGVDGRGRMDLVRDPRNGGAAVIQIEDQQGGREGYTFDLFWGGQGPALGRSEPYPGRPYPGDAGRYPGNAGNANRGGQGRFDVAWAVRTCQEEVRQKAARQFRAHSVDFLDTRMDDNPGRHDYVIGRIDVLHGPGAPEERLQFSCAVNFNNGRVRSVELERARGRYPHNDANERRGTQQAFSVCEREVERRVRQDGYNRVDFLSTRMDDNPGRRDWVTGSVRAMRGNSRGETFTYSCSVDFNNGTVRSVDVRRGR
jgi:hypothetical protein